MQWWNAVKGLYVYSFNILNTLTLSFCVNQSYHNEVTDAIKKLLVPHTTDYFLLSSRLGRME